MTYDSYKFFQCTYVFLIKFKTTKNVLLTLMFFYFLFILVTSKNISVAITYNERKINVWCLSGLKNFENKLWKEVYRYLEQHNPLISWDHKFGNQDQDQTAIFLRKIKCILIIPKVIFLNFFKKTRCYQLSCYELLLYMYMDALSNNRPKNLLHLDK